LIAYINKAEESPWSSPGWSLRWKR